MAQLVGSTILKRRVYVIYLRCNKIFRIFSCKPLQRIKKYDTIFLNTYYIVYIEVFYYGRRKSCKHGRIHRVAAQDHKGEYRSVGRHET